MHPARRAGLVCAGDLGARNNDAGVQRGAAILEAEMAVDRLEGLRTFVPSVVQAPCIASSESAMALPAIAVDTETINRVSLFRMELLPSWSPSAPSRKTARGIGSVTNTASPQRGFRRKIRESRSV